MKIHTLPLIFLLIFYHCIPKQEKGIIQWPYHHIEGSAMHIRVNNASSMDSSIQYLTYATRDGQIFRIDESNNQTIFKYSANAFPFDLKVYDITGDGQLETLVALASGDLIAIDGMGELLWKFQTPQALFNVDAGRILDQGHAGIATGGLDRTVYVLDGQGSLLSKSEGMDRLVHRLAIGSLYSDDKEDILVIENRTTAHLMTFADKELKSIWRKPLSLDDEYINWENPGGFFYVFDLKIADIDNDGHNEIIVGDTYFNKQIVGVLDHTGSFRWISQEIPSFTFGPDADRFTEFFSTAFVDVTRLFDDQKEMQIVSLAGGTMRIFSATGDIIAQEYARLGFSDLYLKDQYAYLGSSPNGDNMLYKVNIKNANTSEFYNLERKGLALEIGHTLQKISEELKSIKPDFHAPNQKYHFFIQGVSGDEKGLEKFKRDLSFYQEHYPYQNLGFITSIKVMENSPPLDEKGNPWSPGRWKVDAIRGTQSVEEILEVAAFIEAHQIPTIFYIGHSCMPFISLETAEKILQTAPEFCLGFRTAEDEDIERLDRYFTYFYKPLSDLCLKYGRKINITKNKGIWWISSPSLPDVYHAMFEENRSMVTGLSTEDSNSRTPEMNILGRSSLWMAGLSDHIVVNLNSDLFSYNRFFQHEYPKHGHPYLRRMIAHTLMGGSMFQVRFMDKMDKNGEYEYNQMGKESSDIFYHLLGKGLVGKPEREAVRGLASIGFLVHKPPHKWLMDAHNGHRPELWSHDEELLNAVLPNNGVPWGNTNTQDHALQKVLFHKEKQFGYNIPATPYGIVAFLPSMADTSAIPQVKEWWHTDGIYIWKNESEKFTGDKAARMLADEFKRAKEDLLFSYVGDDIFLQTIELSANKYRLYLIDPGWIDPMNRNVEIFHRDKSIKKVTDLISRQEVHFENPNQFSVNVPAGAFRIIEVEL
jgi:lambda-carrageenase